jgi:hypothetical protein
LGLSLGLFFWLFLRSLRLLYCRFFLSGYFFSYGLFRRSFVSYRFFGRGFVNGGFFCTGLFRFCCSVFGYRLFGSFSNSFLCRNFVRGSFFCRSFGRGRLFCSCFGLCLYRVYNGFLDNRLGLKFLLQLRHFFLWRKNHAGLSPFRNNGEFLDASSSARALSQVEELGAAYFAVALDLYRINVGGVDREGPFNAETFRDVSNGEARSRACAACATDNHADERLDT